MADLRTKPRYGLHPLP